MSLTEIKEMHKFTYVNKLVDEFYKFMGEIYIEYNIKQNENEISQTQFSNLKLEDATITEKPVTEKPVTEKPVTEKPVTEKPVTEKPVTQSFAEYFLYKLYYNYGIKRRMVNEHIALLYYARNAKGYKSNEPITMLCRHMLLDTHNMRIVSLGIPKAVKLDDFCKTYEIDKTNLSTNFIKDEDNSRDLKSQTYMSKFRLYKFSEGTMITYNPSLKKYSITTINTPEDNIDNDNIEDIDKSTQEILNNNIEIKFNQQFMYSTRKVVGTGNFSSLKTFYEMFEENNKIAETNLENIPEEFIKDKVLVFNIEHPENRIISTQLRKLNTLCAVFQFKDEITSKKQYDNIMEIQYSSENKAKIQYAFKELGNNMVTQIQVSIFKKQIQDLKINLYLPEIIKRYDKLSIDGTINSSYPIDELSIEQLENIVQNKPKDFQGYIIYGLNGERTKITNTKYKELRELKGNKPIVIEQWNTKNLFYLYWRLVKDQKIEQFIKEFDVNTGLGELGEKQFMYTRLFNWFLSLVRYYALYLFNTYHNAFVKRTIQKSLIPYSMKPLCGDLHTEYMKNKVPISPTMVEQFIFNQPVSKIFWRIFMDNKK